MSPNAVEISSKNILIIFTQYGYAFGHNGTASRLRQLNQLYSENHNVYYLVGHSTQDGMYTEMPNVFIFRQPRLFGHSLAIASDINIDFRRKVKQIIESKGIEMIIVAGEPYGIWQIRQLYPTVPIIYESEWVAYDFPDVVFSSKPRPLQILVKPILKALIYSVERYACDHVQFITTVSKIDKARLSRLYEVPCKKIVFLPPYFDVNFYQKPLTQKISQGLKICVIFHGPYSHPTNREAFNIIVETIAPKIQKQNANIEFILAGGGVPKFNSGIVRSLGFVEELNSFLKTGDIAIMPILSGTGIKMKIFDYVLAGVPIVGTAKAFEGLEFEHNISAMIFDDVNEMFIDAIIELAENPQKREMLAINALKVVDRVYNRQEIKNTIDRMFAGA